MKPSVRAAFYAFNAPLEGVVSWFYADVKGLITIGVGNLVDPIETALALPMYRLDKVRATPDEIRADWNAVKSNPHAAKLGHKYAERLTRLRMRDEDIETLVLRKLDSNVAVLRQGFPEWDSYPADAQMAMCSLAWACGPAWWQPGPRRFPRLAAACRARDWLTAEKECHMNEAGNPGLIPRNVRNKALFRNAAKVDAEGLDPARLYWPNEPRAWDPDADTQPVVVPSVRPQVHQAELGPGFDVVFGMPPTMGYERDPEE